MAITMPPSLPSVCPGLPLFPLPVLISMKDTGYVASSSKMAWMLSTAWLHGGICSPAAMRGFSVPPVFCARTSEGCARIWPAISTSRASPTSTSCAHMLPRAEPSRMALSTSRSGESTGSSCRCRLTSLASASLLSCCSHCSWVSANPGLALTLSCTQ